MSKYPITNVDCITYSKDGKFLDVQASYMLPLNKVDLEDFPYTNCILTFWAINMDTQRRYYTFCDYFPVLTNNDIQEILKTGINAQGFYISYDPNPVETAFKIREYCSI